MTTCAARRAGISSGCVECTTSNAPPASRSTGGHSSRCHAKFSSADRDARDRRRSRRARRPAARRSFQDDEKSVERLAGAGADCDQRAGELVDVFADAGPLRAAPADSRAGSARAKLADAITEAVPSVANPYAVNRLTAFFELRVSLRVLLRRCDVHEDCGRWNGLRRAGRRAPASRRTATTSSASTRTRPKVRAAAARARSRSTSPASRRWSGATARRSG